MYATNGVAPFTQFDSAGHAIAGYGPEYVMQSGAHFSYSALQTSLSKSNSRLGLSFQASYTFSKSLDDTSTLLGGIPNNAGVVVQALPQNPRDATAEKGPSTFDVTHAFSLSLVQLLPFDRVSFLRPLSTKITHGWQLLNVTSITSGPPFTVYSAPLRSPPSQQCTKILCRGRSAISATNSAICSSFGGDHPFRG